MNALSNFFKCFAHLVDLGFCFPLNSHRHMVKGPRFKVSIERLEKPGIEPTTPFLYICFAKALIMLACHSSRQYMRFEVVASKLHLSEILPLILISACKWWEYTCTKDMY